LLKKAVRSIHGGHDKDMVFEEPLALRSRFAAHVPCYYS